MNKLRTIVSVVLMPAFAIQIKRKKPLSANIMSDSQKEC